MEKQPSSKMCFVCGRDNAIGFHMQFFQDSDGCVYADCIPKEEHQGFPGVMHGGLVTALLDEILGRTAIASNLWCMTTQLDVRFRKPVPVGEPLKLKGEIVRRKGRLLEGRSELHLSDGSLAAVAEGKYLRIPDGPLQLYQSQLQWKREDE
jgi:acyl-coenzyme A thioesterase PaaI-like protein